MANIDFGDSDEEALTVVKSFVQRINADFYGNGRKGVMEEIREFINIAKGEKFAQEQRHVENSEKLQEISNQLSNKTLKSSWIQIFIGMAALAVAIFFGVLTIKVAMRSDVDILHLFSITPKSLAETK